MKTAPAPATNGRSSDNIPEETGDPSEMLYQSALHNEVDFAKELLGTGVDVDKRAECGGTALHAAASSAAHSIVELLLAHDADAGIHDSHGRIPLLCTLVPDGASLRPQTIRALYREAARSCRTKPLLEFARLYAEYSSQAPEVYSTEVQAPPAVVANSMRGLLQDPAPVAKICVAKAVNPKENGDENQGGTPLHSAAFRGHPDAVAMLLELGADPALRNKLGRTCLEVAQRPHSSVSPGNRDRCIALLQQSVAKQDAKVGEVGYSDLIAWLQKHPEINTIPEAAKGLKHEMMRSNGEPKDWMVRIAVAGGDNGLEKLMQTCFQKLGRGITEKPEATVTTTPKSKKKR